jgi:mannose-6-phosphate isomerase-like protein (cupin superfamily)
MPELHPRAGVVQRVFRGTGVGVGYAELHPDMKASPHSHPWEQIFILLKGRVTLHVDDQVFDMRAGSVVRIRPTPFTIPNHRGPRTALRSTSTSSRRCGPISCR